MTTIESPPSISLTIPSSAAKEWYAASPQKGPPAKLACPYRVKDRKKYNIRDYPECAASGFIKVHQLRDHILARHSADYHSADYHLSHGPDNEKYHDHEESSFSVPKNNKYSSPRYHPKVPKDPILDAPSALSKKTPLNSLASKPTDSLEAVINRIIRKKRKRALPISHFWANLWGILFPESEILPRDRERRFIPPKEHFEFVEEQQELLAIAAVCAEPTPPPGVPEFLKDILNQFIKKSATLLEAKLSHTWPTSGSATPFDATKGPCETTNSLEVPYHLFLHNSLSTSGHLNKTNSRLFPNIKTQVESPPRLCLKVSSDGSDNGHSARDRAMEKDEFSRHHDRHICDSNPREIYDESLSGEPFRDNTNSPALQVLKYSCRTLFNVDLDATDELEQFEQDNLVEIVEDFVEQLKNTFDATTSWTNQQTSSSTQQRSETRSGSGQQGAGNGGDEGHYQNGRGDGFDKRKYPGASKSTPINSGTPSSYRFPCPLRMVSPFTFNVRDSYSCSMTFFTSPKALREHLRDHHKRVDGALFVCVRCFQGFRDKPSHDQHAREDPLCIIEDWKAHHKLGLEGSLLPRPSGSPEEQWREICCSVLRSADANVSPDYAAVIEHFELSQELYRGIPDLISSILGTETYMYTSHDIGKFLEWREEKFQLGQQEGSPEESDLPSSELANGQVLRVFSIIREHYNKVFAGLEESRKAMPYENNQSRDRGGVKSRRPGGAVERGIPTPMSDQSPSALTPGMSSDGNGEYHHRSKRPKLAPRPTEGPVTENLAQRRAIRNVPADEPMRNEPSPQFLETPFSTVVQDWSERGLVGSLPQDEEWTLPNPEPIHRGFLLGAETRPDGDTPRYIQCDVALAHFNTDPWFTHDTETGPPLTWPTRNTNIWSPDRGDHRF